MSSAGNPDQDAIDGISQPCTSKSGAREKAEAYLDGWRQRGHSDILVDRVEEHSRAWIAYYTTRRYLQTGDFTDLPIGASPIVVDKGTGEVHVYGSAPDEYAKFLTWCDNALDHLHRTNAPLRDLLHGITPHQLMGAELPDDAERMLRRGWMIGDRSQLFLAPGPRTTATPTATSIREQEYEHNDVYLPLDDLDQTYPRAYTLDALRRGFTFAARAVRSAPVPIRTRLSAMISMFVNDEGDDFHLQGSRVRFFTDRGTGLEWLDDLEGFQHEAIAVVDREGLEALDRAGRD
ncbi:YrhB domain-containing protein [Myceligenerans xiligouense]|uniref:Immunity protein 35 of polymorphic toxin system n=1 Tax=Myceligenerans xiligouense TaxID=253184 RepID=A0A3N4YST5_9MICO|nr:YrhB domain-containing protein [Myceligenerans xiligouense]RPF22444.1 immunity protein 35 of polymorphic toxin system [Myceligenerans xiligouense]